MDIGKAPVDPVVPKNQASVVDAEQVQRSGVEVVAGDRIANRLVRPFIAGTEGRPASNTAAGHPGRECERVVVAALAPWLHGIRPNSVVQITSVSSRSPRDCKSLSKAAAGRSMLRPMAP